MSGQKGQKIIFTFAVLAFSCLLLSGGSRLIAVPQEPGIPILPAQSWLEASLTCPPASETGAVQAPSVHEKRCLAQSSAFLDVKEIDFQLPQTDANGNVLRHASYMHAVYHVFVLGDGFV